MQNLSAMVQQGDAYHITSPAEDGSGAAKAMLLAMEEAGIEPKEVAYINAHGTSTHHNDLFETYAIKSAFGEAAKMSSSILQKSMIGHLLGAAGRGGIDRLCKSDTGKGLFIRQWEQKNRRQIVI